MLAREKDRLEALRSVKTAFTLAKSEVGAGHELSDEEAVKIIQKLVKQRKDSAQIYKEQNRMDLHDKEMLEFDVISAFLPKQMEEDEIRAYLTRLIGEMNAGSMQQMGPVMGRATKELAGKADGKLISSIVRELLS